MKSIAMLLGNETGQGMVEYGLIIALVAIVAIVGIKTLGPKVSEFFNDINLNAALAAN